MLTVLILLEIYWDTAFELKIIVTLNGETNQEK